MIERTVSWIAEVNEEFGINPKRVLDVGSMDRNKKVGARAQFPDSEYIGVDIEEGPNVDMIADAYRLDVHFERGEFGAVLCLHLLEHVAWFWKVLEQVDYVLGDAGHLFVAIPTINYPEHRYPSDYWRVTEQAMREVIMDGYEVLSLEHAKSTFHKHPFINCLGVKK